MKYIIEKTWNNEGYYSVDIHLKSKDGYVFICDCGDWDNEQAQAYAEKICKLLNEELKNVK